MEPSVLGAAFVEGGPDRKIELDRSPGIDEVFDISASVTLCISFVVELVLERFWGYELKRWSHVHGIRVRSLLCLFQCYNAISFIAGSHIVICLFGKMQLYIEGYLQAMLDTVYKQEYLRVRVIDNQVIWFLFNYHFCYYVPMS